MSGTNGSGTPWARLLLEAGGRKQVFEYSTARSYLSASDPAVVGVGDPSRPRRLEVTWPGGKVLVVEDLPPAGWVTVR